MHAFLLLTLSLPCTPFVQEANETRDAKDFNLILYSPDDDLRYYTEANIACNGQIKFHGRTRPESVLVYLTLLRVKDDSVVVCQSANGKSHTLGDDDSLMQVTGDLKPPENIKPGYYVVRVSVTDRSSDDGLSYIDSDSALIRLVARPAPAKAEK